MSAKLNLSDDAAVSPLNLTARSSAPTAPAAGDIYLDDGTNTLYGRPGLRRYTGTVWEDIGVGDHGAQAYHDANQSIANATDIVLALNQERKDTDGYHDTVTNNSRMTIPTGQGGSYIIDGGVRWDFNNTGQRLAAILLNGVVIKGISYAPASNNSHISITTLYDLAAGDYVELRVFQDSGGALNVTASGNLSPEFRVQRIA